MSKIVVKESEIRAAVRSLIKESLNEGAYKIYNVNMDYPISKPHRTAKKLSEDELREELIKLWEKCREDDEDDEKIPNDIKKLFNEIVRFGRGGYNDNLKQFNKDIEKVEFNWENYDSTGDVRDYKGIKYMIFDIGGDWECPIAVFVYFDGSNLRGYIPIHGNAINLKGGKERNRKMAFGNDDEADSDFCKSEGLDGGVASHICYNKDEVIKDFESALKVNK